MIDADNRRDFPIKGLNQPFREAAACPVLLGPVGRQHFPRRGISRESDRREALSGSLQPYLGTRVIDADRPLEPALLPHADLFLIPRNGRRASVPRNRFRFRSRLHIQQGESA